MFGQSLTCIFRYISALIDQSVPDVLLAVKLRFGVLEELV